MAAFEEYLEKKVTSRNSFLKTASREAVLSGGKRLRPAFAVIAALHGDYDRKRTFPAAAAVEILHAATLVHDDIIDEAKTRRGMPTVQTRWGKDIAVFTGDFLFTKAFLLLTSSTAFENLQRLSRVIKAICEGEVEQYQYRYDKNVTVRQYLKRIGRKTALLFALSCFIGAHESGEIGEDPNGIPNNLVPYIAKVALGILDKIYVFGNDYDTPDGTGVRDYIHVVDLAVGHIKAIEKLKENPGLVTYNLGTGRGYSVMEVIHNYEKACKKKLPYVITDRRPGDIAVSYADPTKANKELGWKAVRDIEQMCRDSYNWQIKNPNGYSR